MAWVKHIATPMGRTVASDLPIEARLHGEGFYKQLAGNFDNWRWRETGAGSIEAYRVLSREETQALHASALAVAGPAPAYSSIQNFLAGPCPICRGVEGCDHTVQERMAAVASVLRHLPAENSAGVSHSGDKASLPPEDPNTPTTPGGGFRSSSRAMSGGTASPKSDKHNHSEGEDQ